MGSNTDFQKIEQQNEVIEKSMTSVNIILVGLLFLRLDSLLAVDIFLLLLIFDFWNNRKVLQLNFSLEVAAAGAGLCLTGWVHFPKGK